MMKYEEFKKVIIDGVKKYMPEEFAEYELIQQPVTQINCCLDGLTFANVGKGTCAMPMMYIDKLYEYYLDTGNIDSVFSTVASTMTEGLNKRSTCESIVETDLLQKTDNIIFQVINTKQNEQLLREVPHREFLDLSVIYYYTGNDDSIGSYRILIRNDIAEVQNLSEEELFEYAKENTLRILPPVLDGMPLDIPIINGILRTNYEIGEPLPQNGMYQLLTRHDFGGAAYLLYEELLQVIAEQLNSDIYILPSSVDDLIIVSAKYHDPELLAEMVFEVNMNGLPLSMRLSNEIYHYDKEKCMVSLATDVPDKSLSEPVSFEVL